MKVCRHGNVAVALALLALPAPVPAAAADDPPAWLSEAVAWTVGEYGPRVDAVVLLRDRTVDVRSDGRHVVAERGAIRVLTQEGRPYAACATVYLTDGGKVVDMRGWLLGPGGSIRSYDRKDCLDGRVDPSDVYGEARVRMLSAEDRAQAGSVFGYEWKLEQRTIFQQLDWTFQDRRPTLVSRLTVRVPQGWEAHGTTMNHEPIQPEATADGLRWELRDLPAIDSEPGAPPLSAEVARVAISIVPDAADRQAAETAFRSWGQVAAWLAALSETQARPDGRVREQALALVAGRDTGLERIRAIGAFVQRVNYVSIQTGMGRGGGYRPHAATEVLQKGYGDCKDKANLMRALLAEVDVPAWLVAIYSRDPAYTREEWPSPQQFNHMILAVQAPGGDSLPSSMWHPELGSLVLFDPTDPWTPFGELPESQQGSLALLVRPGEDGLIRVPRTPPASNAMRRTVEVHFGEDGGVSAAIRESSTGSVARAERALRNRLGADEYRRAIEAWVARGIPGSKVLRIQPEDDAASGRFALEVEVTAQRYGKPLSSELSAVCPVLVSRREWLEFTEPERKRPIVLEPEYSGETVTIELPPSLGVEEFPEPADIETDFASYQTSYALEGNRIRFQRTLEIRATVLPPERYADVQAFFRSVRRGETAMVLLRSGS